jgi:hypothetical protein
MAWWAEESSTDSATFPVEIAPKGLATPESKQEAQDALDAANKDTQKNLNDLKTTIDTVKAGKDGVKKFTEALNSKPEYKKQVEQILGLPWEPREDNEAIIGDIKTLQKALGVKEDGALGPNTFKKLKVRWDARPQGQDYKTFIDGLMNRTKVENPVVVVPEPTNTQNGEVINNSVTTTIKPSEVVNNENKFGLRLVNDAKIMINENTAVNFELDGMIIDRDAYKISERSGKQSYELNIRGKEDNVVIDKAALDVAMANWKEGGENTLEGTTLPKKGGVWEPVTLIINKEKITEKEQAKRKNEEKVIETTATATYETSAAETTPIQSSTLPITPVDIVDTMQNSNLNVIGDKALNTPSNEMWDNPTTPTTEFTV